MRESLGEQVIRGEKHFHDVYMPEKVAHEVGSHPQICHKYLNQTAG